jgi:NADPH2:quinone reductase
MESNTGNPPVVDADTMTAWSIAKTGGIGALARVATAVPVPGPLEALVRVRASALNFSDLLMARGAYQVKPALPFTPGQEIAGEVAAVGTGSRLRVGDRVASKVEWGGFAPYAVVRDDMAIRVPDALDLVAAATLPVVWPTAWIALHERARLLKGENVLVHAAAGGVGLASLQLARAAGARAIALVGSRSKFDACRAAGADEVVCTTDPWVDLVREHGGADVVVDTVGGEASVESLRCLRRGGRILLIGFSSGAIPQIPANRLLLKNASALGVYWSHDWGLAQVERAVAQVLELHARGAVRIEASRAYPFAELPQALEDLGARRTVGKSVLLAAGN